MDLIINEPGLIWWQATGLLAIILFVVSWMMILVSKRLVPAQKMVWLLGTLFLPVLGPLVFLLNYRFQVKRKTIG
jgi:hypothetical protein